MKKLLVLSVFALLVGLSLVSAVNAAEMKEFLSSNYGWTIEGDVKDITCPEGREFLPKEGGSRFNWVCNHKAPWTLFEIVWRVPKGEVIEQRVNKNFAGKYDYTQACQTEKLPSAVDSEGSSRSARCL